MDMRPQNDPAVAAGMRGIHRGMGGEILGGYTAEGQARGSKASGGYADGSRIGNPSTPGLDRWRKMNPNAPAPGQASITAASGNSVRTAAAPAGSQLLKDRQALHTEMKGGVTPGMRQRAKKLGIANSSWNRVANKMPRMAVMPGAASPQGKSKPVTPTAAGYQTEEFRNSPTQGMDRRDYDWKTSRQLPEHRTLEFQNSPIKGMDRRDYEREYGR